jgi:outer membrane protein insertion porin family
MSARAWSPVLLSWLLLALGCRSASSKEADLPFELEFAFEGAETLDDGRLTTIVEREFLRLEVEEPSKASVDDAAFALELFYRSRGHPDVLVDYEFIDEEGAPPLAVFQIAEGPLVRVRELMLEGAEAIPPAQVRALLGSAASGAVFDEERLRGEVDALAEFYLESGFLQFDLEPLEVEFDGDRSQVDLRLVLREGPVFRVHEIRFAGGMDELAASESELVRMHGEKLFLLSILPRIENALLEDYRRAGYPDAEVKARPEPNRENGRVRLFVGIDPGPRVTIEHFRITGNERTRDSAIISVVGIERGSVYDADRVREGFRELYSMGLFESVLLRLEGEGQERTLAIEVVEARSVKIRLEPGWGSYEGPRMLIGIEENNFQGRGQIVALEGTISPLARGANIAWIDRNFLGSRYTAEATFFVEEREEPSFEFVRRGFGFFLRREWSASWSSTFGYQYRPTNVTDDPTFVLPPDVITDTNVAAFSVAMTFDDRNNLLLPTRGRLARARLEWADDGLGSDTEFLRGQLELSQLIGLGSTVLAASARTGIIAPFGSTDEIPLPERYFNGGENSVRSFGEDELLPAGRSGEPVGGEAATTLNLELRRELAGNIAGAAFIDVGNVTEKWQDYWDFKGFRTGIGLGLRYLLPVGPVRLDVAFNPDPESHEDEVVWHFSVGFPF